MSDSWFPDDTYREFFQLVVRCRMCSCQHKIHWSVVAILVNVVSIVLYTVGVATHFWAVKTEGGFTTHTGLFMACPTLNDTCYDTHYHFDAYKYGLFAVIGVVMYAVSIKRLSYSLSWSFILAILGFIVNFAAGILMCVGRNISKRADKEIEQPSGERHPVEQMEMGDTTEKKVWRDDSREVAATIPPKKKRGILASKPGFFLAISHKCFLGKNLQQTRKYPSLLLFLLFLLLILDIRPRGILALRPGPIFLVPVLCFSCDVASIWGAPCRIKSPITTLNVRFTLVIALFWWALISGGFIWNAPCRITSRCTFLVLRFALIVALFRWAHISGDVIVRTIEIIIFVYVLAIVGLY
ncbi:hypothetical protein MAR_004750 [Mya arenaria]|uniref:Uncharacterized protein n=1 Tax=Mya arenaria TaxID=6604 RepID=A0ABY7EXH5_MYAAR|nr:hypothetical protein MAR_004750 [Mya arenaria]